MTEGAVESDFRFLASESYQSIYISSIPQQRAAQQYIVDGQWEATFDLCLAHWQLQVAVELIQIWIRHFRHHSTCFLRISIHICHSYKSSFEKDAYLRMKLDPLARLA